MPFNLPADIAVQPEANLDAMIHGVIQIQGQIGEISECIVPQGMTLGEVRLILHKADLAQKHLAALRAVLYGVQDRQAAPSPEIPALREPRW